MPLAAGTRLGPYEVISPIGKGGMGEVYRARDTKLERDVAIKVLPDELASDGERVARFEREAKLLASLNHPNIASIHGFEESDGVKALVLELVEGPTLAERIEGGPVPVDEAIGIAKQIAEALEAGHEASVIHRDLKPANIKLKEDGTVKVLDYGLAKAFEDDAPSGFDSEISQSPTLTRQGTRTGVILGTAAYMSPEQARGKRVDKRTDIWAFGCCLLEALSGKSPFRRDTLSDTLSAVLRDEPDWDTLPKTLPATIEPLLRHCLVKDPKHRLRDIGDALAGLKGSFLGVSVEPARQLKWTPAPVAFGIALLAIAYALYTGLSPDIPAAVSRWVITLPPEQILTGWYSDAIVFSPDGSRLVYVAEVDGESRLYLRELDAFEAQPIANTEGAAAPFFSPDATEVGFFIENEIHQVQLTDGVATLICNTRLQVVEPYAVWGSNGEILFAADRFSGLYRVDASGGEPEKLTTVKIEQGERGHRWPYFLPNGDVLFSIDTLEGFRTAVLTRATDDHRLVTGLGPTGPRTRYVETGHLIYGQSGTLFAVPFDIDALEASGSPAPVTSDVRTSLASYFAHFAVGASNIAYLRGAEEARLVYVDRAGQTTPLFDQTDEYRYPTLSPNGRRLAMTIRGVDGMDVWVHELDRGTRSRLTARGDALFPVWHPDGERVTFATTAGSIFVVAADGSGQPERVDFDGRGNAPHWSPDGQTLAFFSRNADGIWDIEAWRDGAVTPVVAGPFNETIPRFSPDGRWLAYVSDESGRLEIYAQAYPGPGEKWTLSIDGGQQPVWSRDGREIFYRDGDRMMVVPLQLEPVFRPGTPRVLFESRYATTPGGYPIYDVSLDGTRFIMIKIDATELNEIHVVQNWTEELKRLVPTER